MEGFFFEFFEVLLCRASFGHYSGRNSTIEGINSIGAYLDPTIYLQHASDTMTLVLVRETCPRILWMSCIKFCGSERTLLSQDGRRSH
jgi:hypothetical protein